MEALQVINLLLNFEFQMFGIKYKVLYMVVLVLMFTIFKIIYRKGD